MYSFSQHTNNRVLNDERISLIQLFVMSCLFFFSYSHSHTLPCLYDNLRLPPAFFNIPLAVWYGRFDVLFFIADAALNIFTHDPLITVRMYCTIMSIHKWINMPSYIYFVISWTWFSLYGDEPLSLPNHSSHPKNMQSNAGSITSMFVFECLCPR